MRIVGIDSSLTSTGYCVLDDEDGSTLSCIALGRFVTSTKTGTEVERYSVVQRAFEEIVEEFDVDHVSAEGVVFGRGAFYSRVPALYAMYVVKQQIMIRKKMRVAYFMPSQWYAILYKTADFEKLNSKKLSEEERENLELRRLEYKMKDKANTSRLACEELGIDGMIHDEADAYYLAKFGYRFFKFLDGDLKREDLDETERNIFHFVHTFKRGPRKGVTQESGMIMDKNRAWFDFSKSGDLSTERVIVENRRNRCR